MEFGVLGPLVAYGPDGPRSIGSPIQRTILSMLLVEPGDPVSTDRLIDAVWGEAPPAAATGSLQAHVSRLRKTLDGLELSAEGFGYRLEVDPQGVDSIRFVGLHDAATGVADPAERLRLLSAALELWRGPAFEEHRDVEHIQIEAIRLDERRSAAREERAEALIDLDRLGEAVTELQALTLEYPLREQAVALLMRVLYQQGRQADSLRAYRRYADELAAIGLEPSPDLGRLEEDILSHQVVAGFWDVERSVRATGAKLRDKNPVTRPPDVRYATTQDGVTIAYWTLGSGPAVLVAHNFTLSNVEQEWQVAALRSFYQALAVDFTVIRYDPRFVGVSQPGGDSSLDAMCLDIDAVAGVLGIGSLSIVAVNTMGPVGIAYAASRADRTAALVLCDPDLTASEGKHGQAIRGSLALTSATDADYAMAVYIASWVDPDEVEAVRQIAIPIYERADFFADMIFAWNADGLLEEVTAPTLVLASATSVAGDLGQARRIAAGISTARLSRVEAKFVPYYADQDVVGVIADHLIGG